MQIDPSILIASFSVIVASGATLATFLGWIENRKLRKAQTEPFVDITLESMPQSISLLRLKITNVGLGSAFDFKLNLRPHSLMNDVQSEEINQIIDEFSRPQFIIKGINYLALNEYKFSSYINLMRRNEEYLELFFTLVILAEVSYRNNIGEHIKQFFELDMREFDGSYTLGGTFEEVVPKSLKDIVSELKKANQLVQHQGRLKINNERNKKEKRLSIHQIRKHMK